MTRPREDKGLSILVVEQHAETAPAVSPRTLAMNRGRIVHDGASADLRADQDLLDSPIGGAGSEAQGLDRPRPAP